MRNRRPYRAFFASTVLAGGCVVSAIGCDPGLNERGCAVAGECGGDPTGVWQVASSCAARVDVRPNKQYSAPPETLLPTPATTSGSWCLNLAFDDAGALLAPIGKSVPFGTLTMPQANPDAVVSGTTDGGVPLSTVTFTADHRYVYSLTATSHSTTHIAQSCLGVNAASLKCEQLGANIQAFLTNQSQNPAYTNFTCNAGGDDGCDCSFDFTEATPLVGDGGRWEVQGNIIYLNSDYTAAVTNSTPSRAATFCVSTDRQTLQLTGYRGTDLAQKPGLRSLTLTRIVAGQGEAGAVASPEAGPMSGSEAGSEASPE